MDPFVRDQLNQIKTRMVKNIELVGKYKIEDLMNPEAFEVTARKLATLEAKEMHFMGCFEAAENEPTLAAFEEKFESLMAVPHQSDITRNPVVQRCREFCREQFQITNEEDESSMNESQEIAITETRIATTDPFTKVRLKDPLVNRLCDHVYERATIYELLGKNKRTRCPVVGCRNRDYIQKDHLYDDPYVRAQLRSQATNGDADDPNDSVDNVDDSEMINLNDTELPTIL